MVIQLIRRCKQVFHWTILFQQVVYCTCQLFRTILASWHYMRKCYRMPDLTSNIRLLMMIPVHIQVHTCTCICMHLCKYKHLQVYILCSCDCFKISSCQYIAKIARCCCQCSHGVVHGECGLLSTSILVQEIIYQGLFELIVVWINYVMMI